MAVFPLRNAMQWVAAGGAAAPARVGASLGAASSSGSNRVFALRYSTDSMTLAKTRPLQLDAMGAVHDAVEDGLADCRVAEHVGMPHRLTAESLRSG